MSKRILILSQVYVPDPASVGQHLHDFAAAMVQRGHEVIVHCSSRGYDDPSQRYPLQEERDGVKIYRYSLPFFNKGSMPQRVLGSAWAQGALFFNALLTARTDLIFFSTNPPLVGTIAALAAKLKSLPPYLGKRVPSAYWAMDLNPDQLIAMKKLEPGSPTHRVLEWTNQFIIRNADLTIPLDRYMEERLRTNGRAPNDLLVMPPWPHERTEEPLPHEDNWFREKHDLQGKFVIMYSGNHSPANPLETLLEATLAFREDDSICFAFIGGGAAKKQVNEHKAKHQLTNILSLPYQPLNDLKFSLSAADVHVVSLGTEMVGIVHPCKVYGSMAVGRPILFLGPKPSHVADLLEEHQIGWHVEHGDVPGCVRVIREMQAAPAPELIARGERAQQALRSNLSKELLVERLCARVEQLL